jgi:hypothetical protein
MKFKILTPVDMDGNIVTRRVVRVTIITVLDWMNGFIGVLLQLHFQLQSLFNSSQSVTV